MQLDPGCITHPGCPVVFQIMDAVLLSPASDALMKIDGFSNSLFDGKAAGSEGFKLADVAAAGLAVAGERPYLLDLVLLDP